jgi:hypothetical protein
VLRSKLCLLLLLGCSLQLQAEGLKTDKVQWHGFISQGLIQAPETNFVNLDDSISAELTDLGVNMSWALSDNLRLAGQVVYLDGGRRYVKGTRLDYLFLDWTLHNDFDWQLDMFIGRFKNQHWLYSATRDVPFTRNAIVLPQSVYFDSFRDIAVGSDGLAFKVTRNTGIGEIELNWSWGSTNLSKEQSQILLSTLAQGDAEQDYVHQASLFWRPDQSAWQLGVSLLDSDFTYEKAELDYYSDGAMTVQRVMLNGRYAAEYWELSSEWVQERLDISDFYAPGFKRNSFSQGWYLQGRYNLLPRTWALLSVDLFDLDKDDRSGRKFSQSTGGLVPAYFGYQDDLTFGLTYDFKDNLRLTMEHHWVKGTARLAYPVMPDLQHNKSEYWQMWAMQLMYWF